MGLPDLPDGPSTLAKPKPAKPAGAKVMVGLGVVLLIAGILLGQQGIGRFSSAANDIRNSGDDIRNSLLVQVPIPGRDQVDLEAGPYDVFVVQNVPDEPFSATTAAPADTTTTTTVPSTVTSTPTTDQVPGPDPLSPSADFGIEDPTVTVTGPDGRRVITREPSVEAMFGGAFGQLYALESFTAVEAGTYTIETEGPVTTEDSARNIGIGPSLDDGDLGRLVGGGLLGVLGYLGAGIGAIFLLAGGIWYLVAGDPAAKRPAPMAPAWGSAPGQWPPGPDGPWGPGGPMPGPPGPWSAPAPPGAGSWPPGGGPVAGPPRPQGPGGGWAPPPPGWQPPPAAPNPAPPPPAQPSPPGPPARE